jgi:hypothetical protein
MYVHCPIWIFIFDTDQTHKFTVLFIYPSERLSFYLTLDNTVWLWTKRHSFTLPGAGEEGARSRNKSRTDVKLIRLLIANCSLSISSPSLCMFFSSLCTGN